MFRSLLCALLLAAAQTHAAAPAIAPTQADVPYGPHAQQKLDFYQAKSDGPAPFIFYIHGGGWQGGDKKNPNFLDPALKAGISVISINYRHIQHAKEEHVVPPVKAPLDDAAHALQFVRSKGPEWNLDPKRVLGCGGSAGGFSTLYLAFHPDMADAKSTDPLAKQSTRLTAAMVFVPQTSIDPQQMRAWMPDIKYGPHAFGLPNFEQFLAKREELLPWIKQYSPYELVSSDDPPVYLFFGGSEVHMGQPSKDATHSANFGEGLAVALRKAGVEFELNAQGQPPVKHPDIFTFIKEKLGVATAAK